MKRTDLKIGDVLYYAKPYEWTNNGPGVKVTVAAVEPHQEIRHQWVFRADEPYKQVTAGNGVLVDRPGFNGGTVKTVVQLAHLRGPYDEIAAQVEKKRAADATSRREADEARAEHDRRMGALERRAETGGYLVSAEGGTSPHLRVRADALAALLDAAGVPHTATDNT